ncbi:MAG: hypothetical protein AAF270_00760 [Pseudomonadota bacterium]
MAFSALFKEDNRDDGDQERLLELFSNRVELKKSFAQLRRERRELEKALESSEAQAEQLRIRLEYLEGLLTDGNTAVGTMVFYHLRGLWRRCAKRLSDTANDMSRRIAGRRQVMAIETWQEQRRQQLAELEQLLVDEKQSILTIKAAISKNNDELQHGARLWGWLRARRLKQEGKSLGSELQAQLIAHNATIERHRQLKNTRAPAAEALTVDDKRSINLHVLALAQFLYAHFEEAGLVARAATAISKDVGAIDYGDDVECERIMRLTENTFRALVELESQPEFRAHLARQAKHLSRFARYASETSVIPEPFEVTVEQALASEPDLLVSQYFAEPRAVTDNDVWSVSRAFIV